MKITALDHLVLTVADIDRSIDFYVNVLGMKEVTFGDNRKALQFGNQKINLHQKGGEILPNATNATCGSSDLCFLTDTPFDEVMAHLNLYQIEVIEGIVPRTGALGVIQSIYIRDPDGNLIEISRYNKH